MTTDRCLLMRIDAAFAAFMEVNKDGGYRLIRPEATSPEAVARWLLSHHGAAWQGETRKRQEQRERAAERLWFARWLRDRGWLHD